MSGFGNWFTSIAKGLKLTMRYWSPLEKPVTEKYPEEMPKLPERYRGLPVLDTKPDGEAKCVACGACARMCPLGIINVVPSDKKTAKEFTIDASRCMFCGMCVDICPFKALKPARVFELAAGSREEMIYDKEKLIALGKETGERSNTI